MRISNSTVNLAAESTSSQTTLQRMRLEYWVGDKASRVSRVSLGTQFDKADVSDLARKLSQQARAAKALQREKDAAQAKALDSSADQTADALDGLSEKDKQNIQIIDDFIYRLTGKHLKIFNVGKDDLRKAAGAMNLHDLRASDPQPAQPRRSEGFGLIFDYSEIRVERQDMSFAASGTVQTEDGRTSDFAVELGMSSEFRSGTEIRLRAGDAKVDPLVINVSGGAPALTQRDFSFDLDRDGEAEQISRLMAGSGFLALDKNEDGVINDGGELFGPTMGNGFEELKAYDADGNNWIDENDAIYDKLRVWMDDGQGSMQLVALGQAGVGAIYLGNVSSAFDIKDMGNNTLGTVQSTGVFLKENGGAGTVQHIDLTV